MYHLVGRRDMKLQLPYALERTVVKVISLSSIRFKLCMQQLFDVVWTATAQKWSKSFTHTSRRVMLSKPFTAFSSCGHARLSTCLMKAINKVCLRVGVKQFLDLFFKMCVIARSFIRFDSNFLSHSWDRDPYTGHSTCLPWSSSCDITGGSARICLPQS